MGEGSLVRRFLEVTRDYGVKTAARLAVSKLRGKLAPSLALPEPPSYAGWRRDLTLLLRASQCDAATLASLADDLDASWEICVCDDAADATPVAALIARLRGASPYFRVISAREAPDERTAARWTVEQATGDAVAFLAPFAAVDRATLAAALSHVTSLSHQGGVVISTRRENGAAPRERIYAQRKSAYLDVAQECWPLTAPDCVALARENGVRLDWREEDRMAGHAQPVDRPGD